jgi:hypothetical protein
VGELKSTISALVISSTTLRENTKTELQQT